MLDRLVKFHLLGILPNVAKTGINEVDEQQKQKDSGGLNFLNQLFQEKKPEHFKSYFQSEIQDLDGLYSQALGDDDVQDSPIAAVLPNLLTSFYFIHDETLERRSLSIIMRIFNQREELIHNIQHLQIIFDPLKTKLYDLLSEMQIRLRSLVDRSEIWLSEFIKKNQQQVPELDEILDIVKNLRWGFFQGVDVNGKKITLETQSESNLKIDSEKQSIMMQLGLHTPIINLINDQMSHLVECMSLKQFPKEEKIKLATLFIYSFQFLKNFCKQNHTNQMLLYEHLSVFTLSLQFNLGQIPLICEIFKDNNYFLTKKVTSSFLNIFVKLIHDYGRQEHFLDPFLTMIKYREKYIFDNQLQVLNIFLIDDVLLFAEPDTKDLEFNFQGEVSLLESDFINDLQEDKPIIRDTPYRYHSKLMELLLATTMISTEYANYNPNQPDFD